MKRLLSLFFITSTIMVALISTTLPAKAQVPDVPLVLTTPDPCKLSSQEKKQQEGIDLGYCEIKKALPKTWITNVEDLITQGVAAIARIVGFLGLLGLIISGIMYITAGSDSDRAVKAQKNIGWVVTGLVIFMLIFWIPTLLSSFVRDLPNADLEPTSVDESGVTVAKSKTKASTDLWPDTVPKANLEEVKAKRALAVNERADISIRNNTISPNALQVNVGTVIVWHNFDKVTHRYTKTKEATTGPDEVVIAGETYYLTILDTPGEFDYVDADALGPVAAAKGKITVVDNRNIAYPDCYDDFVPGLALELDFNSIGQLQSPEVESRIAFAAQDRVTITWKNNDTKMHTITGDYASSIGGPKATLLKPGQSLQHTFRLPDNVARRFVYFDETQPDQYFSLCIRPAEIKPGDENDVI